MLAPLMRSALLVINFHSLFVETAMLELRGVSHRYGDVLAVDQVDLTVADDEFFTLLGPSGCGKTTLLRLIAGF